MLTQHKMYYGHVEMLLLRVLADGACHPYRLRQELADRSDGYFAPGLGRLYPLLRNMERRHLVKSRLIRGRGRQQRRRYTLTPAGRRELAKRTDAWSAFAQAVETLLHDSPDNAA